MAPRDRRGIEFLSWTAVSNDDLQTIVHDNGRAARPRYMTEVKGGHTGRRGKEPCRAAPYTISRSPGSKDCTGYTTASFDGILDLTRLMVFIVQREQHINTSDKKQKQKQKKKDAGIERLELSTFCL